MQKIWLPAFFLIAAFCGCAAEAQKKARAANARAIAAYQTEFDDPAELERDWIVQKGDWKIEDGALIGEGWGIAGVSVWLNKPLSDNFELEYEVEGLESPNDLNCTVAGDLKTSSGYVIIIGGYHASRCRIGQIEIRDERTLNRKLCEIPFETKSGKTYRINVRRLPDQIVLSIDGAEVLRTGKEQLLHSPDNQYFGFYTWDNKTAYKNLKITDRR